MARRPNNLPSPRRRSSGSGLTSSGQVAALSSPYIVLQAEAGAWREVLGLEADSYFKDCERDKGGRCLPSGAAGQKAGPKKGVGHLLTEEGAKSIARKGPGAKAKRGERTAADKGIEKGAQETPFTLKPSKGRAFDGDPVEMKTKMGKAEIGKLGEDLVVSYLRSQGMKDAAPLNHERNNFPLDLVHDHEIIEVKAGLASNAPDSQKWRLTIGEPGKKEKEWLRKASPEAKAKWNSRKQKMIHERKARVLAAAKRQFGRKMKAATMTCIINPDTKTVDIFRFDGFHNRIGWRSDMAEKGYVGSFSYADRKLAAEVEAANDFFSRCDRDEGGQCLPEGGNGFPPAIEDPAPGKDFYYHATSAANLESIAEKGIKRPDKSLGSPISLTPHLPAASQWGSMLGGKDTVLLRMKRSAVKRPEFYDGDGDPDMAYDAMDPSAELATFQPIAAGDLEVYHRGHWHPLRELKASSDYFSRCERDDEGRCLPEGGAGGQAAWEKMSLHRTTDASKARWILPDGTWTDALGLPEETGNPGEEFSTEHFQDAEMLWAKNPGLKESDDPFAGAIRVLSIPGHAGGVSVNYELTHRPTDRDLAQMKRLTAKLGLREDGDTYIEWTTNSIAGNGTVLDWRKPSIIRTAGLKPKEFRQTPNAAALIGKMKTHKVKALIQASNAWDEAAHPRGKTGPGTTPGSFAPSGGGAEVGSGKDLQKEADAVAGLAQKVYDEWTQDEEGMDEELGAGGICQLIADEVQGHFGSLGYETASGGDEEHASVLVLAKDGVFEVDIPPSTYETGGGYNWKKIPGVKMTRDDVVISKIGKPEDWKMFGGEVEGSSAPDPNAVSAPEGPCPHGNADFMKCKDCACEDLGICDGLEAEIAAALTAASESYFARCKRDEKGWCLPEGAGGLEAIIEATGGADAPPREHGPIDVMVWRSGPVDEPPKDGRGLFFADSEESAKHYQSVHDVKTTEAYRVQAKKVFICKGQYELAPYLFKGKSYNDLVFDMMKKHSPEEHRAAETKMAKALRAKGFDALIYTKPPAPAKFELALLKGEARKVEAAAAGGVLGPEAATLPIIAHENENTKSQAWIRGMQATAERFRQARA